MYTALQDLGYKSYHCVEAVIDTMKREPKMLQCWVEALKAKYFGHGKPYQREEFDKLLGAYDAVTDAPCINFVEELLEAYPNAKVILTNRDADKWVESFNKTAYIVLEWRTWDYVVSLDPMIVGPYWTMFKIWMNLWTSGDIHNHEKLCQGYIDHYDRVRALVPKENLLEFSFEDGWELLCNFLGKSIPADKPYPHKNDLENIVMLHGKLWWGAVIKGVMKMGGVAGAVGVVAVTV